MSKIPFPLNCDLIELKLACKMIVPFGIEEKNVFL